MDILSEKDNNNIKIINEIGNLKIDSNEYLFYKRGYNNFIIKDKNNLYINCENNDITDDYGIISYILTLYEVHHLYIPKGFLQKELQKRRHNGLFDLTQFITKFYLFSPRGIWIINRLTDINHNDSFTKEFTNDIKYEKISNKNKKVNVKVKDLSKNIYGFILPRTESNSLEDLKLFINSIKDYIKSKNIDIENSSELTPLNNIIHYCIFLLNKLFYATDTRIKNFMLEYNVHVDNPDKLNIFIKFLINIDMNNYTINPINKTITIKIKKMIIRNGKRIFI